MSKDSRQIISITEPLPGWIRFQHVRTGRTLDFNPDYAEHRQILTHYANNPDWADVTPQPDHPIAEQILPLGNGEMILSQVWKEGSLTARGYLDAAGLFVGTSGTFRGFLINVIDSELQHGA